MSMKQIKQWIFKKLYKYQLEDHSNLVKHSFSKDEYGQGFYNGIQFVFSSLSGEEPNYLSLEEFKNAKKEIFVEKK